jgi:hypothetical protein
VRKTTVLVATLILIACGSTSGRFEKFRAQNRASLLRLHRGMPRDSVLAIMGVGSVEISNKWEVGLVNPRRRDWTLTNPHRTETLSGPADTLEVLFYYTDVKRSDDAITDDELTPLVIKDGRLIGWGYSFLDDSVQKYEIRIR